MIHPTDDAVNDELWVAIAGLDIDWRQLPASPEYFMDDVKKLSGLDSLEVLEMVTLSYYRIRIRMAGPSRRNENLSPEMPLVLIHSSAEGCEHQYPGLLRDSAGHSRRSYSTEHRTKIAIVRPDGCVGAVGRSPGVVEEYRNLIFGTSVASRMVYQPTSTRLQTGPFGRMSDRGKNYSPVPVAGCWGI